jgi:hypothetical protein
MIHEEYRFKSEVEGMTGELDQGIEGCEFEAGYEWAVKGFSSYNADASLKVCGFGSVPFDESPVVVIEKTQGTHVTWIIATPDEIGRRI